MTAQNAVHTVADPLCDLHQEWPTKPDDTARCMTCRPEKAAAPEPGEAYYRAWGWSGCAGSAWDTLPPATKDGWRHAEEAQARATSLSQKIDRCTEHLRAALGYSPQDRDAGLESLAVQVRRARPVPPGQS